MRIIALLPGRYQPFHKGHKANYDFLVKTFGDQNVYVATSDSQAPLTSPFTFVDKEMMMNKLGIPVSKIIKSKNPYVAEEFVDEIQDKDNTALIIAISKKDMGDNPRFTFGKRKDGKLTYLQPMPKKLKDMKPMSEHAYVLVTPVTKFRIRGIDADSASAIRKIYMKGSDEDREQIIADLYGESYPDIKEVFDHKIGNIKKAQKYISELREKITTSKGKSRLKMIALLESVVDLEHSVDIKQTEEVVEDYINEV